MNGFILLAVVKDVCNINMIFTNFCIQLNFSSLTSAVKKIYYSQKNDTKSTTGEVTFQKGTLL